MEADAALGWIRITVLIVIVIIITVTIRMMGGSDKDGGGDV